MIADGPAPGSWTGPAAMAEGWRDFLSAFEEFRTEVDEYRERALADLGLAPETGSPRS